MARRILYRDAVAGDVDEMLAMTEELADFERLRHEVTATRDDFLAYIFGPSPRAQALIAECDGHIAGQAIWYCTFSTFVARPGLYLEDIYVRPAFRRLGIGRGLMAQLAARAADEGCAHIEWAALNWNANAIDFYRRLGALPRHEWTGFHLDAAAIAALATGVADVDD